ncbi:hypothetical protein DNTS_032487, partial [Danionella cerebrum]
MNQTHIDLLRLLAEVHFINGEVTIEKLCSVGADLNGLAVLSSEQLTHPPEAEANWKLYSDWLRDQWAYAIGQFQRGAELGAELGESWLVINAAVYLWNHSKGGMEDPYQLMTPSFSSVLELLRCTGHQGESTLMLMLCDAVIKGLLQSARVRQESQEPLESGRATEKTKRAMGKSVEKHGSNPGVHHENAAVLETRRALEVCEFALKLSNGDSAVVPLALRKKLLNSWVSIKQRLQQQINTRLDINDGGKNEAVRRMSGVLLALEMLQCNSHSQHKTMEFSVPASAVLIKMASECMWTDPAVELYVWTKLALYAHQTQEHCLVLSCTQKALRLEQQALHWVRNDPNALSSLCSVQELLSCAASVRGQSLIHEAQGHHRAHLESLTLLQSAVSLAEQAGSWSLCLNAAGIFWKLCVPLLETTQTRRELRKPLELVLQGLTKSLMRDRKTKTAFELKEDGAVKETPNSRDADDEKQLKLLGTMLNTLIKILGENGEWRRSLKLLEELKRDSHAHCKFTRLLLQQCVLVKARLGECVLSDMQRLTSPHSHLTVSSGNSNELFCSGLWHIAALNTEQPQQRLRYFQKAINVLKSSEVQWIKVDLLLEFSEWLFHSNFSLSVIRPLIEWAVDILLFTHTQKTT